MGRKPKALRDESAQPAPGLDLVAAQDVDFEDTLHHLDGSVAVDGTVLSPVGTELASLGPPAMHNVAPHRGPTGQDAVIAQLMEAWRRIQCGEAPERLA